jgi:hypothetical protein
MYFDIVGSIERIQTMAVGTQIRQLGVLIEQYGNARWSKLKGTAVVRLPDGTMRKAEIHWYEAHGIGRKRLKIKRFLD